MSLMLRAAIAAALLLPAACNGLYLGDNPGPDVRKETGPLTVPPPPAADRPGPMGTGARPRHPALP